jgi:hypothetical protein
VALGCLLAASLGDLGRALAQLGHQALHPLAPALEDLVPLHP